jgi:hypothetical protein
MRVFDSFLRVVIVLAGALLVATTPHLAQAQSNVDITPDGQVISLPAGTPAPPTPTGATGATFQPGEIGTGNAKALSSISSLFNAVIATAVTASGLIKPEADKLAGGLAVITLVLAFARYAATTHPTQAWMNLFEELAILGIFASIYVGYATFAPGFYGWFGTLANDISGANVTSGASGLGAAASDLYDAFAASFKGAAWYAYPALLMAMAPVLIAYFVLSITALVFMYYSNIGQLQAAAGIVMGQIAVALGFSSFTRGYFRSWLDYMVSASMYTVVAAILMKLVSGSLLSAIAVGKGMGLSTPVGATYVFDLSVFVFLLSFEIPKIAGMFGGGANASGSALGKVAKIASGGLL